MKVKQEVRRRSAESELWRTAFARREQMRYSALLTFGWRASRSSGSRAKAEVKGKREARRRSAGAELWRTAFARKGEMRFLALLAFGLACQP